MLRHARQVLNNLLFPDPEFLKFFVAKSWKYHIFLTVVLSFALLFSLIEGYVINNFYVTMLVAFRWITICCAYKWRSIALAASSAAIVVDTACIIMSHTEMLNLLWDPMDWLYVDFLGLREGPPCPWCVPKMYTSWTFGIYFAFSLMFTLPFRNVAFVLPPCLTAYVSCLAYARWNNYPFPGGTLYPKQSDVRYQTVNELALLCIMIFTNVGAKLIMDTSEFELWNALKESRHTVIHEKVLRCQAEHTSENLKTRVAAASKKKSDAPPSTIESASSCSLAPRVPRSMFSAPPILEREYLYFEHDSLLHGACPPGGDCLQEEDMVWTSENPHPIPVKDLLKGQHVLCYDHLSKGLKHTEVLTVVAQGGSVQWANVTLADDTSLKVTADHPFLTQPHGETNSLIVQQAPVCASDLKPHHDQVLVMKFVPVDVKKVDLDPMDDQERVRVSIGLHQPSRHSVFVSRGDQLTPQCAMAVGASNLDSRESTYLMRSDNTFLTLDAELPSLRRTNSSPGCLQSTLGASERYRQTSMSLSEFSVSDLTSTSSDLTPASADECRVRVGTLLRPVRECGDQGVHAVDNPDGESRAVLKDFIHVQKSGLPSIGSFNHMNGKCSNACWFENQRQHGRLKKCSMGLFCERCHCDHPFLSRGRRARHNAQQIVGL